MHVKIFFVFGALFSFLIDQRRLSTDKMLAVETCSDLRSKKKMTAVWSKLSFKKHKITEHPYGFACLCMPLDLD